MGNTSFSALRNTEHDECAGQKPCPEPQQAPPPPKFAELTGAYWLEPIYTGLAQEWSSQGRTVPGAPKSRWQKMADERGERREPLRTQAGRDAQGTDTEADAEAGNGADRGARQDEDGRGDGCGGAHSSGGGPSAPRPPRR
jgi:hypothetical protein